MIGFKGLPSGILVGLVFAGLAFLITGMASAAAIFGLVFGGVIYAVVRYRLLDAKPATSGFGGSSDVDDDTSTHDGSWSSWMSSTSSDPAPSDTDCYDSGSDSSGDGGSCDSGGDSGGGGD